MDPSPTYFSMRSGRIPSAAKNIALFARGVFAEFSAEAAGGAASAVEESERSRTSTTTAVVTRLRFDFIIEPSRDI
jgi:hypothetical protein